MNQPTFKILSSSGDLIPGCHALTQSATLARIAEMRKQGDHRDLVIRNSQGVRVAGSSLGHRYS